MSEGNNVKGSKDLGLLRSRAEDRMADPGARVEMGDLSHRDAKELIHELETHQVELELQNEDLREAHLALSEAHQRYVNLYDFAPVGYLTLDREERIVEANLRAAELLGIPREQLTQLRFADLVAEADQDALFLCMRQLRADTQRTELDLRLRRPDDELRWARCDWAVERPAGDGQLRVTLSDITDYKRLHAQLALTDRLSSVGLLAASIGHEVNNPLTYLLYNLQTATEELPAVVRQLTTEGPAGQVAEARIELEDVSGRLCSALEGAERIRDIVKGMRAFSRVDEALVEPLSLNAVIAAALTMTARQISCRAALTKDLGDIPKVSANYGQLCQVFVNLLINAAQSIEEGNVVASEIAVRSWAEDGEVVAEVTDTGCGIAPADLDKIFDPFFTTKPVGSGTGLGLAIAMNIVNGLGGQLSIESTQGRGTRATIRLPATGDGQAVGDAPEGEPLVEPPLARILVIDDEPTVGETMAEMLDGHEVVVAGSGIEGRDVLSKDRAFDVVLCDLMMPDFSGVDLLEWMQQHAPALVARVVFVTGGAFTPRAQHFLNTVNPLCLAKPFGHDALLGMVQRAMNRD